MVPLRPEWIVIIHIRDDGLVLSVSINYNRQHTGEHICEVWANKKSVQPNPLSLHDLDDRPLEHHV